MTRRAPVGVPGRGCRARPTAPQIGRIRLDPEGRFGPEARNFESVAVDFDGAARAMAPLMQAPHWLWLFAASTVCLACQTAPDDLREWRPADHRNLENTGAASKGQVTGQEQSGVPGLDQVTMSAWQNNCVTCHGKIGRGDGPQAFLYQPRDLGDPEWQASVTDEQLIQSIQQGKNKMPGFALPPTTAQGLVRLVRLLGRGRQVAPATSESGSSPAAAPPASAPAASAPAGASRKSTTTVSSTAPETSATPAAPRATSTGQ